MGAELSSGRQGGQKRRVKPVMNITPLVDVVLVLLIIFMVVTPMLSKQLWLNVPPKVEDETPPPEGALPPVVLTLGADGLTRVNGETIAREELATRLLRMLNARPDKIVFFDANNAVSYGQAVAVLDIVKGGGIENVAVLAEELGATPATAGAP